MSKMTFAQLLGGFFSQQATQRQLMTEQIAGYQIYLNALHAGYTIKTKGLGNALNLKGATKDLHAGHIDELSEVQSAIANDPKVKTIRDLRLQITTLFANETAFQQKAAQLNTKELTYYGQVRDHLFDLADQDMNSLNDLVTSGKLQMTDEARLERLDKLYTAMKDKLAFAGSFTTKAHNLALSRQHTQAEKQQVRKLYGIQP